ncbi:MAG: glutamate 5-kinase [Armatimonadetes bacterium]|nr:glutamate 5-kinase [Armatimonadota bacterium]
MHLGQAYDSEEIARVFRESKSIFVKISSSLALGESGWEPSKALAQLARQIAALKGLTAGRHVSIVSSGAVALGTRAVDSPECRSEDQVVRYKKAASAVGQLLLMDAYRKAFEPLGCRIAQLLLTRIQISRHELFQLTDTLQGIRSLPDIVPVFNENDPILFEDIHEKENDRFAALLAGHLDADVLVLLSNVKGLYAGSPSDLETPLIDSVCSAGDNLEGLVREYLAAGGVGKGGIGAKISAIKIALSRNLLTVVADGRDPAVLADLAEGRVRGTLFVPASFSGHRRHRLEGKRIKGAIRVDAGATVALTMRHASLLFRGVVAIEGQFVRGDVVEVLDHETGNLIAVGRTHYDSAHLYKMLRQRLIDLRSDVHNPHLHQGIEVINRDYMILKTRGAG